MKTIRPTSISKDQAMAVVRAIEHEIEHAVGRHLKLDVSMVHRAGIIIMYDEFNAVAREVYRKLVIGNKNPATRPYAATMAVQNGSGQSVTYVASDFLNPGTIGGKPRKAPAHPLTRTVLSKFIPWENYVDF